MAAQTIRSQEHARRDARAPRVLAIVALATGVAYLLWRLTTLGSGARLTLSIPLLVIEAWSILELSALAFQAWRTEISRDIAPGDPRPVDLVDVLIDASSGSAGELERTLVGVSGLASPGGVLVVDTTLRPSIAGICRQFGVRLVLRSRVECPATRVPAGDAPLWLWLEAGQVPMPGVLEAVGRHFADPKVAVCQIAAELMNSDSLVHLRGGRDEDALIRRVTGTGMARLGLAPWFGPGSMVRREALASVGGFVGSGDDAALRTLAVLHAQGWSSDFESRPFIRQTASDTLDHYLESRRRRARAFARLVRSPEGPFRLRGLRPRHRLAHLSMAVPFGRGVRQVLFVAVLSATLVTGLLPVDAGMGQFVVAWSLVTGAGMLARRDLAQGAMAPGDWVRQGWRTLEADLHAFGPAHHARPDLAGDDARRRGVRVLGRLRMLTAVTATLQLALLLRAATLVRPGLLPQFSTSQRILVLVTALVVSVPMIDVLQVIALRSQRRRHHRLPVELDIEIGSTTARTIDLSPMGVGVRMAFSPAIGATTPFRLSIPTADDGDQIIRGTALVRAATADPGGAVRVGLEFQRPSREARLALIRYCAIDHADLHDAEATDHHPHLLDVVRGAGERRSMQVLSATSLMAAVLTMAGGPASAEEVTTSLIERVCVEAAHQGPVAGVAITATPDGDKPIELGTTDRKGCLATKLDLTTTTLSATLDGLTAVSQDRVDGSVAYFRRTAMTVRLLDTAGAAVTDVTVRHNGVGWVDANLTQQADDFTFETIAAPDALEVRWNDLRFVTAPDPGGVTILRAATVAGDPANPVAAYNSGGAWVDYRAGGPLVGGRYVFRLADGEIVRSEVPEGHVVDLPAGTSKPLDSNEEGGG